MNNPPYTLQLPNINKPLEMFVHGEEDQHVSAAIVKNGIWEAFETQLVIERLQTGDICLDIGANIGYYSLIASRCVGERGHVFSFEPDPENFKRLKENITQNNLENVHAAQVALSDCDSEGSLYLNPNNWGDHQVYDNGEGRVKRSIQLRNGTDYLLHCGEIRLVKIDTQGAEYHVIKGLLPLLQRDIQTGPLHIIIEFWPYGLRRAGATADKLLDLLSTLNLPFAIIDHINHALLPCTEQSLREWVSMVEEDLSDQGFMNILLGG